MRYAVRRVIILILLVIGATLATIVLTNLLPGDPVPLCSVSARPRT